MTGDVPTTCGALHHNTHWHRWCRSGASDVHTTCRSTAKQLTVVHYAPVLHCITQLRYTVHCQFCAQHKLKMYCDWSAWQVQSHDGTCRFDTWCIISITNTITVATCRWNMSQVALQQRSNPQIVPLILFKTKIDLLAHIVRHLCRPEKTPRTRVALLKCRRTTAIVEWGHRCELWEALSGIDAVHFARCT